jgi:hypothetical protein
VGAVSVLDPPTLVIRVEYEGGIEALLDCLPDERERLIEWLVNSPVMRDLAEAVMLLHGELVAEREGRS